MSNAGLKIGSFDAWALAQLIAGKQLGELVNRVSPDYRVLAQQMEAAPREEREVVWDGHLETLSEADGDALVEAVAQVDPGEPPPEDDAWEPLELEKPVPVEPFPADVFPDPVAHLVREGAAARSCRADFFGMAVLAVAGAAVGRSVSLRIKEGWFASPAFYIVIVGRPGDGKSPALEPVAEPLKAIDHKAGEDHQDEMVVYKTAREAYEDLKKARKRGGRLMRAAPPPKDDLQEEEGEDEASATPSSETEDTAELLPPVRPVLRRYVVDDATTEALACILSENPRGVLMIRDELSALIGSLNQYKSGRGTDREFYLSAWSGQTIAVDRKGNGERFRVNIYHPFLGIIGGTQPDVLSKFTDSKGRDDGFLDRFLTVYPDPMPRSGWNDRAIPAETAQDWATAVNRLTRLPLRVVDDKECPLVVGFTPEARAVWIEWFDSHRFEQNADDFPDWLRGPWAKIEQYAGRIALTLHMLKWAVDTTTSEALISDVSVESVKGAIRVVEYLKVHTRRVRLLMRSGSLGHDGGDLVQTQLKWIRRKNLGDFSERDLLRDFPRFKDSPKQVSAALGWLISRNCIRPAPDANNSRGARGRKPSRRYEVNPRLCTVLEHAAL